MQYRCQNRELFLFPKIVDGRLETSRFRRINVSELRQVSGTKFPDFDSIQFHNNRRRRPAEVKFVTSKFDYHQKSQYVETYRKFLEQRGIIISVKHDMLPIGLSFDSGIDVYELDYDDFIQYCKENFQLLFARQIDIHQQKNFWIMYASKNFYEEQQNIIPAKESKRWAPCQNLGNIEIGIGDIVLLFNCRGLNRIQAQQYYMANDKTPSVSLSRLMVQFRIISVFFTGYHDVMCIHQHL